MVEALFVHFRKDCACIFLFPSTPHSQAMSPPNRKAWSSGNFISACHKYNRQSGESLGLLLDSKGGMQAHTGEQGGEGDTGMGLCLQAGQPRSCS